MLFRVLWREREREKKGTGNQRSLIFAEQKKKICVLKRSKADCLVMARLKLSNKKK
jgi:hypothetical protein